MNRSLLRSTVVRMAGGLLVATGLLSTLHARDAAAGGVLPCPADQPCITDISAGANADSVVVKWNGDWDAYHVIWSVAYPGGQTTRDAQIETRAHASQKVGGANARFATYRVSVQGCTKHTFSSDECTGWTTSEIVPALPYGPDTCKAGFVWRQATTRDHICVTPAARDQAARDNAAAASRREPGGGAYGPDTCKAGFVWREAVIKDHVCVTPAVRAATARDNDLDNSRRAEPRGSVTYDD